MPKMRVHEVAKLLDKSSKEIITKLKEQGVEVQYSEPMTKPKYLEVSLSIFGKEHETRQRNINIKS